MFVECATVLSVEPRPARHNPRPYDHMIEIAYTIPGQPEKIVPFYKNRRKAEKFVSDLKKKFPKATYTWFN